MEPVEHDIRAGQQRFEEVSRSINNVSSIIEGGSSNTPHKQNKGHGNRGEGFLLSLLPLYISDIALCFLIHSSIESSRW